MLINEDLGMRLEAQCGIFAGCGVYLESFRKVLGGSRERFGRLFGICVLWLGGRAVIELAQLALGFVSSVK